MVGGSHRLFFVRSGLPQCLFQVMAMGSCQSLSLGVFGIFLEASEAIGGKEGMMAIADGLCQQFRAQLQFRCRNQRQPVRGVAKGSPNLDVPDDQRSGCHVVRAQVLQGIFPLVARGRVAGGGKVQCLMRRRRLHRHDRRHGLVPLDELLDVLPAGGQIDLGGQMGFG